MSISREEQAFLEGFEASAASMVRYEIWPRMRKGIEGTEFVDWGREGLAACQAISDREEAALAAIPPPPDRTTVRRRMKDGRRILEFPDGTEYKRTRKVEPTRDDVKPEPEPEPDPRATTEPITR